MAEDALQIDALKGNEGAGGVRRRPRELLVVGGDEVLGEVGVGGGDGGDAGAVEFVDEPALEGPIEALTASTPLGEYEGICSMPRYARARPTCVSRVRSTRPPAFGV